MDQKENEQKTCKTQKNTRKAGVKSFCLASFCDLFPRECSLIVAIVIQVPKSVLEQFIGNFMHFFL